MFGSAAAADPLSDRQQLAGDYFVGASVFLFERTVLAAFAPPGSDDAMLDAGAIVLARENADHEAGSVPLQAILGWLNADLGFSSSAAVVARPPGLDRARMREIVCLAYGSDPEVSERLAANSAFGAEERKACIARYLEARQQWTEWLLPYRKPPGAPAPMRAAPEGAPVEGEGVEGEPILHLAFAPTMEQANQLIADAMRENGLFQVLTDDLNASLVMPRPLTALITQCGEPRAFYNPDRGEAVICYEMLRALLEAAP